MLDLYGVSAAAREAIFAPRVLRFLRLLFEQEPMAFQSLYFRQGTQQPVHQDAAFVRVVLGLRLTKFRPRRGDVVFWHADLAHGGAAEMTPGSTRRSLVTHYCPADNTPTYFGREIHSGRVRHASMAYYCHPVRADLRPLPNALLAVRRLAKQTGWRLVQRLRAIRS